MPDPVSSPALVTGLHPTLNRWQVLFYGLGSMLGAGIYALVGRAAETLGNAIWLAFLAAMTAALLTGLSYACVGGRYAKAGGAAYVTHRAIGWPALSYVVGIAVRMSGLTSMATGVQAIAENLEKAAGMALPIKLIAIGLVLLVGALATYILGPFGTVGAIGADAHLADSLTDRDEAERYFGASGRTRIQVREFEQPIASAGVTRTGISTSRIGPRT